MSSWNVYIRAVVNRTLPFGDDELEAMGEEFRDTTTYGREGGSNIFGCDTAVALTPEVVPPDLIGGECAYAIQVGLRRISNALSWANDTRMIRVLSVEADLEEETAWKRSR